MHSPKFWYKDCQCVFIYASTRGNMFLCHWDKIMWTLRKGIVLDFLKYFAYLYWQLWNCLNETCNTKAWGKYMFKYIQIQYNYEAKSLLRWDSTWSVFNFPFFIVLSDLELLNSLGDTMQYSFLYRLLITAVTRKKSMLSVCYGSRSIC